MNAQIQHLQTRKAYPAFKQKCRSLDDYLNEKGNFHTVDYIGYSMPGHNENTFDWCGTWATKGCLNEDRHSGKGIFIKRYRRSCYRADCGTCWKKWLARLSNRCTTRLLHFEKESNLVSKHIVVSVPSWLHSRPIKELRKNVYRLLKKVNVKGGVMIFHAFRKDPVTESWYFSPHFHIIGFGWIVGIDVTDVYQKEGWIIKNLGVRKSVFATVIYQLSHCAIIEHKHTTTWFGVISYSKLKMKKIEEEHSKCPECGEDLVELEPCYPFDKPPDEDFEKFTHEKYFQPKMPYIIKQY